MTDNYEDNMTGEPDAVKAASPVRKGIERKGLATIPRSQSTLHLPLQSSRFLENNEHMRVFVQRMKSREACSTNLLVVRIAVYLTVEYSMYDIMLMF